jgi:hypothetical protein
MATARTPIPTEYKGVRYDSKSEAIFARVLDVAQRCVRLVGHPSGYLHRWDMLAEVVPDSGDGPPYVVLVEYKPCRPTETYCENLQRIVAVDPACCGKICIIVYGSPWCPFAANATYGLCVLTAGAARVWCATNELLGLAESAVTEARRYRFDLCAAMDHLNKAGIGDKEANEDMPVDTDFDGYVIRDDDDEDDDDSYLDDIELDDDGDNDNIDFDGSACGDDDDDDADAFANALRQYKKICRHFVKTARRMDAGRQADLF